MPALLETGRQAIARAIAAGMSLFSPEAALRYLHGHDLLAARYGYAAGRRDGANGRWRPLDGRADMLAQRDAALIRARARAMVRDNPNLAGALRRTIANVIFTGITPQAQLRDNQGALDKRANDTAEGLWSDWAEAVDLWEQQKMGLRHLWVDGGFFLHFYPDEDLFRQGLVPLGLELLDMDALDTGVSCKLDNGNTVYLGREYNSRGRVLAYYMRESSLYGGMHDPLYVRSSGASAPQGVGRSVRIEADNCLLVMERERIGQTLPVSWLHACIMTLHNFDEYQNAEEIAARINAAFCVVLKSVEGYGTPGNDLSGNPVAPFANQSGTDGRRLPLHDFVASGRIDDLPPNKTVEIVESKRPGNNYEPYTRTSLRRASSGVGMSYETFSNDYSDASYSSVRQAVLEERRGYRMQQAFMIAKVLAPVWQRFCLWGNSFGLPLERRLPVRWQRAGWSWVDPAKDAKAAKDLLEINAISLHDITEEQGRDFDDTVEQREEEVRVLGEKGLLPQEEQAAPAGLEKAVAAIVRKEIDRIRQEEDDDE